MDTQELIERAKAFMRAVASMAPAHEIEAFYAPDVVQEEFPNRLLPNGRCAISPPCGRQARRGAR